MAIALAVSMPAMIQKQEEGNAAISAVVEKKGSGGRIQYEGNRAAIKSLGRLFKLIESNVRGGNTSGRGDGLLPTPGREEKTSHRSVIHKYWKQRYQLFSRFDQGVKLDAEGWFSVTPESIAEHHAKRCGTGTIVDCFAGVGGNTIQFARRSHNVIAVDIDPLKIRYAKHNARVYGVGGGRINFVVGDCRVLAPKLKGDVVFLSPPWGGPDYSKAKKFDMKTMLKPCDGQSLFNMAKKIAPKVVMFLPRNVDMNQLAELALSASPPWSLEVEKNYLNGKFKAITAYFSQRV